ncbi:NAD-dependent epimerase/dehydratase family protein [Modestobacter excelsi]|uniref:NAD-dependent epimerase/dehydratase family protein n=1 Tax=Modestobacter excelsi TaxID=2213161 RepID=UPI001FEA3137|nr:NAD(P)-dependent oxidoreductase [Modestobacter excelsi]
MWTERVGTNPDLEVLLHGGSGATAELYECCDTWFPAARPVLVRVSRLPVRDAKEPSSVTSEPTPGRAPPPHAGPPGCHSGAGWLVSGHVHRHDREVIDVNVFVAGGSGVLGRRLVPQLVARGHQVTATTTSKDRLALLERLGARAIVMDGLDAASVGEAVAAARPDAIVHQMTAIAPAHAGKPDIKHFDKWFSLTVRLRTEGTDHLLAAAQAAGRPHVVAQSYASWNGIRQGGWVKTEEDPLDTHAGTPAQEPMEAVRYLEKVVIAAGGAALRYGALYGPGATDDQVELVRKRQYPLIGDGGGYSSWIHLDDAASATVLAVERRAAGVFNIVDDEPAPASEWLPYLAESAGGKRPMRVPKWLGRAAAGDVAVMMMVEGRGFSNAKAKRELGWTLRYPSWRQGFREGLS